MSKVKALPTSWDLSPLLAEGEEAELALEREAIEKNNYRFINKWRSRTDYLGDPAVLGEALDELEKIERRFGSSGKIGAYFSLRHALEQNNPALKARLNQIEEFAARIENDRRFFELNLSRISPTVRARFLKAKELAPYRHYLERLFAWSAYLLSEKEEAVLNLKTPTSYSAWVRLTSSFLAKEEEEALDEKGKPRKHNFAELSALLESQQKKVRDSAAAAVNAILARQVEVAEAELNAILGDKKVNDQLRKLPRPDSSRHLGDDVETNVVDAMLSAVRQAFPLAGQYYRLKAKLLGLPRLKYHERVVAWGELKKEYTYPEALALVERVFEQLDPQFAQIARQMAERGQIDVYPRIGKTDGAFCAHQLLSQPVYVLLNHNGSLRDVLTLAHELGHAIHSHLVQEKQNALQADYSLATAEVASTFMEDFVLEELLKEADAKTRLSLIMRKLDDEVATIFRQVALYLFEQELHRQFREKGYLSREEIGALFGRQMAAYMGEAVEQSPGSQNWWVHWSHIRTYFYVYSYASGLLISKALQAKVRKEPGFIERFKELLGRGAAASPGQIFKDAGIDITDQSFWQSGIDGFARLLEEAERLAASIKK